MKARRPKGAKERGFAAGCVEGLCRKVLRFDRPHGRRVLKFDGPFGPEGCGIALTGDDFCMPPTAAGLYLLLSGILFSDVCRLMVSCLPADRYSLVD